MRALWVLLVTAAVVGASLVSPARAQSTRELIRSAAEQSNLAKGFQALSIFNVTPGISAVVLYVDDDFGDESKINNY